MESLMSVNIQNLISLNADRWRTMKVDPTRAAKFTAIAKTLCAPENKARFHAVTDALVAKGFHAVPWWFIAVVAYREYGGPPRWDRQLGQGDPLNAVSRNEPAGRGPFLDHPGDDIHNNAWLRCALDALIDCGPHAALWGDWTPGGVLTLWEEYNGLGYASRGVPSAYVWSGSDVYSSGKYVADHVYRADVKDVQEGCAPILRAMQALDSSIIFSGGALAPIQPPPEHPAAQGTLPPFTAPVTKKRGLIQEVLDAFLRL
jgi:lysozyme family protein